MAGPSSLGGRSLTLFHESHFIARTLDNYTDDGFIIAPPRVWSILYQEYATLLESCYRRADASCATSTESARAVGTSNSIPLSLYYFICRSY
jgi:hypothetical protein